MVKYTLKMYMYQNIDKDMVDIFKKVLGLASISVVSKKHNRKYEYVSHGDNYFIINMSTMDFEMQPSLSVRGICRQWKK